jgi:membrane fusion protein (multidrug efflux system)
MAATLLIAPASPQDQAKSPRKEPLQESATKVKELRKERLAVLKELTDQLTRQYQTGRVEIDELLEARVQLLHAQLDAAEKQSERLALYKNLVDELKQAEKIAQGRLEAARGTMASVLKIKARRLEAEIHLEQARAGKSDVKEVKHERIVVSSPQVKNVTVTQQYVCQILAQRHIKIRALQKGYVETIPVKEGQTVKKGDVIFKLTPGPYKAKLDAELAHVKIAEVELQNTERLFKNKVVGENELAVYKAKLENAKARAELAQAELNFTEVRAPFDGTIDRLQEQSGSLINEGETLTTLTDNRSLWVYFNVPEARYLEYVAGQAKDANVDLVLANGKRFKHTGTINAIEARFNNGNGTISLRADFPNPEGLLRHGMTGNVLLHQTLKDALVIPQRATFEGVDKRYVYVVDKEDVAHRREIVVKNELDDLFVIGRGVGAEDRIVVEGTRQVRDGEKVQYELRPPDRIPGH